MVHDVNNSHLHKWMCPLCGSRRKDVFPLMHPTDECTNESHHSNVIGVIMICRNCHNVRFFMGPSDMSELLNGKLEYFVGPTEKVGPSNIEDYNAYRGRPQFGHKRHRHKRVIIGERGMVIVRDKDARGDIITGCDPLDRKPSNETYSSTKNLSNVLHEYKDGMIKIEESLDTDIYDKFH